MLLATSTASPNLTEVPPPLEVAGRHFATTEKQSLNAVSIGSVEEPLGAAVVATPCCMI